MFTNNMEMQINILEACKEYGVKRLINPIGSCVYPGDLEVYVEEKLWDGCIHESVLPFAKNVVSYAEIITLSITAFMVRYISVSYHEKNYDKAQEYYSSSMFAAVCCSALILLASFFVASRIDLLQIILLPIL